VCTSERTQTRVIQWPALRGPVLVPSGPFSPGFSPPHLPVAVRELKQHLRIARGSLLAWLQQPTPHFSNVPPTPQHLQSNGMSSLKATMALPPTVNRTATWYDLMWLSGV
jgi:hypothetical protein